MLRLQKVYSLRPAFALSSKVFPAARRATSSDAEQVPEPSFTEMCEGFFDNARSYVEHRLLTKPDPPGTRPEKFDDKKHKIKGIVGCAACPLLGRFASLTLQKRTDFKHSLTVSYSFYLPSIFYQVVWFLVSIDI